MIGSNDGYRDHCVECIHFAPWPERAEFIRENLTTPPDDYPVWACMRHIASVRAVSPHDGTACTYFDRGDRDRYIKEVCHD